MSLVQRHRPFSKQEFERALRQSSAFMEFPAKWYEINWEEVEEGKYQKVTSDTPISEYCYIVPLIFNPVRILKIYSSVRKSDDSSRDVGGDAIRVVLADNKGEPKHKAFTRINRTGNWEWKLRSRIATAIKALGFNTSCPDCGQQLFLKTNRKDKSRFLGCSTWPDCEGKRPFESGLSTASAPK